MKKYFISQILIDSLCNNVLSDGSKRWASGNNGIMADGRLALYNKNSNESYYFNNPTKAFNKYGYYAERGQLPRYFKDVVKVMPENDNTR